jgi:hypothetical protein
MRRGYSGMLLEAAVEGRPGLLVLFSLYGFLYADDSQVRHVEQH